MILKKDSITVLQQEVLHTLLNRGALQRARGGYVAAPGAKPFTVRTVQMLERAGLVYVGVDRKSVAITQVGSTLMLQGQAELPDERLAG